jgi:hypothetical protein
MFSFKILGAMITFLNSMNIRFLGALAKLPKNMVSSCLPTHLSVRVEKLEFDWTDFQ